MLRGRMQDTAPPGTEVPSGRHRPVRRRRWGLRILLVLVILVTAAGVAGARYYDWCRGASGPREPLTYEVERGTSGSEIVDDLHDRGVLRCGLVAEWHLRRSGLQDELRTGTFDLTTNMPLDEVLEVLTTPPEPVPTVRLTVPEGYRLTQIADRVQEQLGIGANRFLRAIERGDWALPPYLPEDAASPEGFLFPETYEFRRRGTKADDVVQRLVDQFAIVAEDLPWENADDLGVTPYEVVVIASMIEEEARLPEERPVIAGVIYNRLEVGMTLGIDATLLYDDPTPDGQLSFSDLEFDSPYNTRINPGLPPTPISSPGLASLEAALAPADTEFFFYVLCGKDGHHEFAATNAEHEQNRVRCGE
jgi:UPF0755 protein